MFVFENVTEVTISNCSESCPIPGCGGIADLESGTYDFIGNVMTAFRAPGMTRQKLEAFAGVVSQAAEGKVSPEMAAQQAKQISHSLGALLAAAHSHGITFDRILAVILAIQAFWAAYSSDADVQAALTESRHQTELSQKMLSELQAQNASLQALVTRSEMPLRSQAGTNEARIRRGELKAKLLHGTALSRPAR